jgi:hypothetical protein
MLVARRRGLADFVNANFPEPYNPIWQGQATGIRGLADFVDANFPEPHNPIYSNWPKGIRGMGCGCGGGCSGDCGMGALAVPAWAMTLPAPLNTMAGPLPVVYWIAGGLAAAVVLPMLMGGKRGRR